jgi:uncharacterized MnhB-related membrane protein
MSAAKGQFEMTREIIVFVAILLILLTVVFIFRRDLLSGAVSGITSVLRIGG